MTPAELELHLIQWGRAYGEEASDEWGEEEMPLGYGTNSLARGMAFAPGSTRAAAMQHHRAGQSRRKLMGAAAGLTGAAPSWSSDPVRSKETRSAAPREDARFTGAAERVQTAWLALERFDRIRAVCLQVEYQVRAQQSGPGGKAEIAGKRLARPLGLKRYRDEVRAAKVWMHGRLSC